MRAGGQCVRARRLPRFEYFLRDQRGSHRRWPAGVKGQVGDQLADLVLGDAVAEGALEVTMELPLAAECNERRHGDQAAIALRQARAFPNLAIDDLLGKLDELWRDRPNLLAADDGDEAAISVSVMVVGSSSPGPATTSSTPAG